jgi:hypothetical protein
MQTSLNAAICVSGNNYQDEDSMPENIRQAFERVVSGALKAKRSLFVGRTARFVPKLQSRIVCDSEEFSNVPRCHRRSGECMTTRSPRFCQVTSRSVLLKEKPGFNKGTSFW